MPEEGLRQKGLVAGVGRGAGDELLQVWRKQRTKAIYLEPDRRRQAPVSAARERGGAGAGTQAASRGLRRVNRSGRPRTSERLLPAAGTESCYPSLFFLLSLLFTVLGVRGLPFSFQCLSGLEGRKRSSQGKTGNPSWQDRRVLGGAVERPRFSRTGLPPLPGPPTPTLP